MKYQELIERYIYAATRFMKREEKEDTAKELQSIIDDMLEERCGGEEPDEAMVKEVLNELGDPKELYEKYSSEGKDCLIGAPYYGVYKYVLKTALMCVVFGLVVAQFILLVIDLYSGAATAAGVSGAVETSIDVIVNWIVEMIACVVDGAIFTFAAVTAGFAYMYHKGIKMDTLFDSLDQLPRIPKKEETISKVGIAFGIGISVLFFTLFLACPQVLCMYKAESGEFVSIFDVEFIQGTWYLIMLFAAIGIGREIVKLIEGTYTKKVLVATMIADISSAVLAVFWLFNPAIINPSFTQAMAELFAGEDFLLMFMTNFNYFFLCCILLALALDMGTVVWKYYRANKE